MESFTRLYERFFYLVTYLIVQENMLPVLYATYKLDSIFYNTCMTQGIFLYTNLNTYFFP